MEKYLHWNQKVVAFQLRGFPGVTENRARENADKITLLDRKTRYAIDSETGALVSSGGFSCAVFLGVCFGWSRRHDVKNMDLLARVS